MDKKAEFQEQIKEWRKQIDTLEDMIEAAHKRVDELEEVTV